MADVDLTSSTENLAVCAAKLQAGGLNQGDLVVVLYACVRAIYAICNNLDGDSGTVGTDYLAKIGTPLDTAARAFVVKPSGATTAA